MKKLPYTERNPHVRCQVCGRAIKQNVINKYDKLEIPTTCYDHTPRIIERRKHPPGTRRS